MSATTAGIPERSAHGLAALDIFYADFNDIDFYVEDAEQENLYEQILKKLFRRQRIIRIFPLGGKPAVLQHATSGSNGGIRCFRAYIVDRDFDDLLGRQFLHPQVFYLDRFCIENHLLEPSAALEIVVENHPKRRRGEIKDRLSLDAQLTSFYRSLRRLFNMFLCAQLLDLGVANCSLKPERFCNPRRLWEVDDAALTLYAAELTAAAQMKLLEPPLIEPVSDHRLPNTAKVAHIKMVSGKFVAAMLFHYVKAHYGLGSMTFESFVYRLAKNCALRSMRPFAARVRAGKRAYEATIGRAVPRR